MNLIGTRTERNTITAFAGESQARNRYTYYASKARDEGFIAIAAIFEETAEHEKEHAKRLFKFLQGGEALITAAFPAGVIGSTLENLRAAAAGERYEHTQMYPLFAQVAREEGFAGIALVFEAIAVAERGHDARYTSLADDVEAGRVFQKEVAVRWRCRNCGYIHEGIEAPKACPACAHPQGYFQVMEERV